MGPRSPEATSLAQRLALWADRLRDVVAMGLYFSGDPYDEERYRTVQDIAMEMLALATGEPLEAMETLRAPVFSRPTPLVGGDAAVIDEAGQILLIRRADDGLWAIPGGALEVGETPLDGVMREVLEETGVRCRPVALVGVYDSRRCGLPSRHHLYLVTFLLTPIEGAPRVEPTHSRETLDVGWFARDRLPTAWHPGSLPRIEQAYRVWREGAAAWFDR